ncbi:hypothetical protein GCM10009759_31750 [Kitasatospora saccharophila]|uniref:Uncharacterized protein n=1 Tax=Kitasatospora saccharophila TaxID=407973 RepID=A0ABN2WVB9_9ACTN
MSLRAHPTPYHPDPRRALDRREEEGRTYGVLDVVGVVRGPADEERAGAVRPVEGAGAVELFGAGRPRAARVAEVARRAGDGRVPPSDRGAGCGTAVWAGYGEGDGGPEGRWFRGRGESWAGKAGRTPWPRRGGGLGVRRPGGVDQANWPGT